MTLSIVQCVLFPIMLLFAWRLRIFGAIVPKGVLLAALCCAATSVAMTFTYDGSSRDSFVVSRFNHDEFGTISRIFREAVEGYAGENIIARRYFGVFATDEEVRTEFKDKDVSGVVWGDEKWIMVSLFVPGMSPEKVALVTEATGLEIIDKVPAFGLSLEPLNETARFVGRLFNGLVSRKELDLLESGGIAASWTNFAHRAYPLWILANQYLAESVREGRFEEGTLNCAIERYVEAESMLRFGDNTSLQVALLNNHAVALSLRYYFSGDIADWREARQLLRRAKEVLRQPNLFGVELPSGEVLVNNLRTLWREGQEENGLG